MRKLLGILIVAALAAVLACGWGGSQLTAAEYAEACGDLGLAFSTSDIDDLFNIDRFHVDDVDDIEEALEEIKDLIREFRGLNPPDSLQDFHDARADDLDFLDNELLPVLDDALPLLEDLMSAVEDEDSDELEELVEKFEELEDELADIDDEIEELMEEAEAEFDDLSSKNQRILRDSDCR